MPTTTPCPICQRPIKAGLANPSHPFCSQRCRLVDLGNWLGDRYVIAQSPAEELDAMSDEELAALLREPS